MAAPPEGCCSIEHTLQVVGGKWTTLLVYTLSDGPRRFGELRRSLAASSLGRISPKTLTARLRELEAHGVVWRRAYAEIPPRVEYGLTERGESLRPVLDAMTAWGRAGDPNLNTSETHHQAA